MGEKNQQARRNGRNLRNRPPEYPTSESDCKDVFRDVDEPHKQSIYQSTSESTQVKIRTNGRFSTRFFNEG